MNFFELLLIGFTVVLCQQFVFTFKEGKLIFTFSNFCLVLIVSDHSRKS